MTVSPASITLDKSNLTKSFTIGGNHDGTISVTVDDSTVASVTRNGNTVTVSHINKKTGSTTIRVNCTAGTNYTKPTEKTVSVTAKFVTIYGAQWDGTSTTKWSRTDASASFTDPVPAVSNGNGSSPFDNLQPWAGMTKSNRTGGVVVAIPKFYYKWTKSGNTLKLQIADGETDGFNVSPAHADRGDGKGERDVVYVGRYHCATSTYKSETNKAQACNVTRSNARTNIHNLGSTIWQFDYAMRVSIQMLYLVEFADWNSQAKIGYGCSAGGSKENNGKTDAMQYHTGTTAANRDTYGYTQYRNIEGWWDNVYDWMDGCYYNSNGLNVIKNPNQFSDSANGTLVGKPVAGYPSDFTIPTQSGLEWALFPSAAAGSTTNYVPDYWDFYGGSPCLRRGGSCGQNLNHGPFCVDYYGASSATPASAVASRNARRRRRDSPDRGRGLG